MITLQEVQQSLSFSRSENSDQIVEWWSMRIYTWKYINNRYFCLKIILHYQLLLLVTYLGMYLIFRYSQQCTLSRTTHVCRSVNIRAIWTNLLRLNDQPHGIIKVVLNLLVLYFLLSCYCRKTLHYRYQIKCDLLLQHMKQAIIQM